ncbi:hypothetical protein H8R23_00330 [Flavobacterium sp. F-380]|uniref:Secreted protein n=1 Tax=Flavobacterium kayseriense TaxID=2764714 RepID=A0ABR7J3G3_9FLAO|nr:hypothetical protein [Flavobacterium kayseriense]MBC5839844.1 hypothetical protein [Flavobacterium kayseriense]MBC5847486.1 hypothetical protein [Flavobacterium kayseriense]MBU0941425.1 hypothetical protein [Bacteroidota bacterium]
MKSIIILILVILFSIPSFSQNEIKQNTNEGIIEFEELPAVVIKRVGKDFSLYIPDRHPDKRVRDLQKSFIAYDIGKDFEGYDSYLVVLETKTGSLAATYNDKGKLIRVVENYKDVKVPNEVMYSIYKTYPGWSLVNDKYLYSQEEGDIIKKQYNCKIKNGNQTKNLVVQANGEILKVR